MIPSRNSEGGGKAAALSLLAGSNGSVTLCRVF